jgi:DNA-binding transcriptional LysR family regulator
MCRRVEAGELDLAFAILPPIDGPYATPDLIADPFRLLVPASSPLAGSGVPPDRNALQETPMTRVLDMDGLLAPRRIGLVWHREREPGPAARAFIELALAVCAEL